MKSITCKNLKAAVITAAVSATALLPFALATAAGEKTIFAAAKISSPDISQAKANASPLVEVSTVYPDQTPTGLFEKIKEKIVPNGHSMQVHSVGVYLGKGLVLASDPLSPDGAEYRVTLADGRSIEATRTRWQDGVMLLRLASDVAMPLPAKVSAKRLAVGDDVAVFGLADLGNGSGNRYVTMLRAYVSSAQAFDYFRDNFNTNAEWPMLAIKIDGGALGSDTGFSPVFSRPVGGELVGMVVVRDDDRTAYIVPADTFVAGANRNLARN